jgi:hypothetical protein
MAAAGHVSASETTRVLPVGTEARAAVPINVHKFGLTSVVGGDQ